MSTDDAKLSEENSDNKKSLNISLEKINIEGKPLKPTNINRRAAGSNWNLHAQENEVEKPNDDSETKKPSQKSANSQLTKSAKLRQKRKESQKNKYVAMDCEMVGVGPNGINDMLARVSIVNKSGEVLLDKYVKPQEPVVDYRTEISGIRPHNIEQGEEFDSVQNKVIDILQGKILVGHSVRNDLSVLHIQHPYMNIRDTARYKPLSRLLSNGRTPSLKRLSEEILGIKIQIGEHSSVEDAKAAMSIYNRLSNDWEKYIKNHYYKQKKKN